MHIRRASRGEREGIDALLEKRGLAPLPSHVPLSNVLVALGEGAVVGVVAMRVAGRRGVVCALAVAPEQEAGGLATSLLRSLLARAQELGLRDLWAPDPVAPEAFATMGFARLGAQPPPSEVRRLLSQLPEAGPPELWRLELETRF